MNEYWEIPYDRGVASMVVWGMQPTFELRKLTLVQYTASVNNLPGHAQGRASREADLSDALEAKRDLFAKLADLNVRVPGAIDGLIEDDNDLHGQLDHIFAITSGRSEHAELRRARLVRELWPDFDAQLAALTPPKPPFTVKVGDATLGQEDFEDLINACLATQQTTATAEKNLTEAKSALRSLERKVDRDNKRWYGAWTKVYPAGTPEGDNARSNVPTEQGTPPPTVLEIESLTVQVDKRVAVMYAEQGGDHATTLELQYQLPGEPDFGHTTPVVRRVQMIGPFPGGTLVTARTRAANSTPGQVFSATVQVLVPA